MKPPTVMGVRQEVIHCHRRQIEIQQLSQESARKAFTVLGRHSLSKESARKSSTATGVREEAIHCQRKSITITGVN